MLGRLLLGLVILVRGAGVAAGRDPWMDLNDEVARLQEEGRYLEALPLAERSLAIARARYPPGDLHLLAALNNAAEAYRQLSRFPEAEAIYREALRDAELPGADQEHLHAIYSNLGKLCSDQGRNDEALRLYEAGVARFGQLRLSEDRTFAAMLLNQGELLHELGRLDEAERVLLRALQIQRRVLPPRDPDVAVTVIDLVALRASQGELTEQEAEQAWLEVVAVVAVAYRGRPHPMLALAMGKLGNALKDRRRYRQAELAYQEAVEMAEAVFGRGHPRTAGALDALASLYLDIRRRDEALACLELARRAGEEGSSPGQLGSILTRVADVLDVPGSRRLDEAEQCALRGVLLKEEEYGVASVASVTPLSGLGATLFHQGKLRESELVMRRCIAILETDVERHVEPLVTAYDSLALALEAQGRHMEAEAMNRRVIELEGKRQKLPRF